MARLEGTDAKYKWARRFLRMKRETDTVASVELKNLGPFPSAAEVRWGPAGADGKCLFRGCFFVRDCEPFLTLTDDLALYAFFRGIEPAFPAVPIQVRRGRAPILFDEEV